MKLRTKPCEIAAMVKDYGKRFPGYTADTCGKCKATINTFANCPGWRCPGCGDFNGPMGGNTFKPWPKPDFGPTDQAIREGFKLATPGGDGDD